MDRNMLKEMLQAASKTGEFTLASGKKSDWYLDCRPSMANYEGLRAATDALVNLSQELGLPALGGPATAAVALMAGAMMSDDEAPDRFVYTRSAAKDHGTGQKVEGANLGEKPRVLLVDDVLTSGGSLLKSAAAIKEVYPDVEFVGAWVLVDREQGGRENLQEHGIRTHAMFTRTEILAKG